MASLSKGYRRHVHTLEGMADACGAYQQSYGFAPAKRGSTAADTSFRARVVSAMLGNDESTLAAVVAASETLADAATGLDPRLAARPGWAHAETGIEMDVAAFLSGEPECCLERRRMRRSDRTASGDPVRVVISTDAPDVPRSAAVAFIAAAKLAAQFVPLEIWWQGSWLHESGEYKNGGHVFLVPLVSAGSLDFSRLLFVLCSPLRDDVSNRIMQRFAIPSGWGWGNGVATWSQLQGTRHFVPASGIRGTAGSVAAHAAYWAGMEPVGSLDYETTNSATQTWEPEPEGTGDDEKESAADRKARRAREKEQERTANEKAKEQARQRAARLS